jgi:topoisomerase-4 subunit B
MSDSTTQNTASAGYGADSIKMLKGLEAVRKRPGMYIGDTSDGTGLHHMVFEVVDNAIDEALAGYCDDIVVTIHADNSISVTDNGRGIPTAIHKDDEQHRSAAEIVMTELHAGGKFDQNSYKVSGGLHGVGVSVVNALSTHLEVTIKRDGQLHRMTFASGEKTSELEVIDTVGRRNTGTRIRFTPDTSYFDSPHFSVSRLRHNLRAKAVLCPGLTVTFLQEKSGEKDEWFYEDGLRDYLRTELANVEAVPLDPFTGSFSGKLEAVDWAIQWLPEGGDAVMESYVNLIPTAQGGTHVNGLRTGLLDAMREFCEFRNLLPRGVKLSADDIWERVAYVLSFKMQEPQFSGQTKERLSSRGAASFISGVVKDSFSLWLNQQTEIAEILAELFINNAQRRLRASKKVARKKVTSGPALPGKLADCSGGDTARAELFLVEGDSAGGSAKQARDREFQAVMPLRGKILNTWEVDPSEVLASQEVHDIAVAIGVDPGSDKLDGLRYDKVCILADADSDGLHIATLLCALFVKHFRPVVAAGHVFVAMPPLYRVDLGKETFYALDEEEKQSILDRIAAEKRKGKISVTRFKGLGEMNPLQLRETTMAPDTRRLVMLTIEDGDDTDSCMDMLLGKKRSSDRRAWLEAYGNIADVAV